MRSHSVRNTTITTTISLCCSEVTGHWNGDDRYSMEQRSSDNPFVFMIIAKNYGIAGQFKESVDMWERCLTLYGTPRLCQRSS